LSFISGQDQVDLEAECAPLTLAAEEHGRAVEYAHGLPGRGIWFSLPAAEGERPSSLFGLIPTNGGWILTGCSRFHYLPDTGRLLELTVDLLERWPEAVPPGERIPRLAIDETWRRAFGLIVLDDQTWRADKNEVRTVGLQRSGWRAMHRAETDDAWEEFNSRIGGGTRLPEPSCVWDVSGLWLASNQERPLLEEDLTRKTQEALRKCTVPEEELYVLDWNHTCFLHDPHAEIALTEERGRGKPVYPNGDSYLYLPRDFRFGILGSCVDQILTVYGEDLLAAFAANPPRLFTRRSWSYEHRQRLTSAWEQRGWARLSSADEEVEQWWELLETQLRFTRRLDEGIPEPAPSVTWDLSAFFALDKVAFVRQAGDLTHKVLRALQQALPTGSRVYALDALRWYEHYTFDPHQLDGVGRDQWAHLLWPDGNFTIFFVEDLRLGLFGHPLQKTLCIFGAELLPLIEADLPVCLDRPIRRNGATIPLG
jgi:hypothetical protein